ncbi:MAG: DUF4912 domain-containing protein [Bullifex sp.]
MVLIKIDSLSQKELEYIAGQEGIEDFDTLSREELIDVLKDIYEDEDSDTPNVTGENVNKRYVAGLSDYRGDVDENVPSLPGVERLPLLYPETSVHILSKNASWLYCYWSVAPSDLEQYDQKFGEYSLLLSVCVTGRSGVEKYEIEIGREDSEWNINVPHTDGSAKVSLMLRKGEATYLLSESETLPLVDCYWLNNPVSVPSDESLFRRYLAPLTNREGYLFPSEIVEEIINNIRSEVEKV